MAGATRDMSLLPVDEPTVPAKVEPQAELVAVIRELASNPSVDVEKLRALIDMKKEIDRYHAEQEFNAAFSAMQPEIPVIVEKARTDKGKYAPLEDIIEVVRPIMAKHGFGLSHETFHMPDGSRKIVGVLTHRAGHKRTSEFIAPPDKSGSKNDIQALGSTGTYGRRYTTNDLLCIVTRGEDDDARRSGKPAPPDGYGDWLEEMSKVADEGLQRLEKTWADSKAAFQQYAAKHDVEAIKILRAKARKVKA